MEIFLEFIFSVLGEFLIEIIGEVLCELGCQYFSSTSFNRVKSHPVVSFIGYCILGAIAGAISLFILPHQLISSETFAIINLLATPILAGIVMCSIGYFRKRKGRNLIRLDSFLYGFAFAFVMAIIRFYFGGNAV